VKTHFPLGDGPGLVLTPFRGVRYAPARVGELANVTSPPYDVIGPGTLEQLRAASPYNIVGLTLPALDLDPRKAGQIAAARLADWLDQGVLATDESPALYVYEQSGPGFVQRGLIGLVRVGSSAIHAHEDVMPGPVAGRRELMAAVHGNLEPILLVYNGGCASPDAESDTVVDPDTVVSVTSRLVEHTAEQRAPLASAVTDDGVTHRIWALTDPAEQAAVAADLGARTALIADGHHRYAAYGELRSSMRATGQGDGPWDYGLAVLVDADAHPLRLGPIHRVIPHLDPAEAASLAAHAFTVTELPPTASGPGFGPDQLADALGRLADMGRSGPAFLLAGRGGLRLISHPDPAELAEAMPAAASPRWQALDAAVMQELLLARLWLIKDNERDVLISHDAAEAVRLAVETGGTAVLCNPMELAAVMELAAHGERVPRKSTSFGPKPRTGLVLRTFDA
jgi:uncharacterized protein (DUF1015 family)